MIVKFLPRHCLWVGAPLPTHYLADWGGWSAHADPYRFSLPNHFTNPVYADCDFICQKTKNWHVCQCSTVCNQGLKGLPPSCRGGRDRSTPSLRYEEWAWSRPPLPTCRRFHADSSDHDTGTCHCQNYQCLLANLLFQKSIHQYDSKNNGKNNSSSEFRQANQPIVCKSGDELLVDYIFNNQITTEAIRVASCRGWNNMLNVLLSDSRLVPNKQVCEEAIGWATSNGHYHVVKFLLEDQRFNPAGQVNRSIVVASLKGYTSIVQLLLSDPRVNAGDRNNHAIWVASLHGHVGIVRLLLKNPRVDPLAHNKKAFSAAIQSNRIKMVELFLSDVRIQTSLASPPVFVWALSEASRKGHLFIVKLLLRYQERGENVKFYHLDSAKTDDFLDAIVLAGNYGHDSVVKLLLSTYELRIKPIDHATSDQYWIRWASEKGLHRTVTLLLTHSQVDPTCNDNEAIRKASQNGHFEVTQCLLADSRVNPAVKDNEALRLALEQGHENIIKLLLRHPQVFTTCPLAILLANFQEMTPLIVAKWAQARKDSVLRDWSLSYQQVCSHHLPTVLCSLVYQFAFG